MISIIKSRFSIYRSSTRWSVMRQLIIYIIMSQTYYLWNSYKGIVNKFDNATGQYGNLVTKFNDLLHRGEGEGNQNYYTGKIGNLD